MEDKAREEEDETLRELILEQLANLDQSKSSDDGSYKVRLSCILEDDESESSGACQKEGGKKSGEIMKKESEKCPPEEEVRQSSSGVRLSGSYDSEASDEFEGQTVQITDLDEDTPVNVTLEERAEEEDAAAEAEREGGGTGSEESEDFGKAEGFPIKKLKSSDNVHTRPFVVRRRELSSDSSDLDISVSNSASSELKIVEITEEDDENTLNVVPDIVAVEPETSFDEETEPKSKNERHEVEVLNNETLSNLFAKVSKTYLEKTKSHVKWEENETVDKNFAANAAEERSRSRSRERQFPDDHLQLHDIHIRGTSPKQYDPPIPPETYLWEELKRLRERGGYPWTYLDKPAFDEATWKKYMEHVYEPINPPPPSTSREELAGTPSSPTGSSIPETEKESMRIPSSNELTNKEGNFLEKPKDPEFMEVEETISSAKEAQVGKEEDFSKETMLSTSTTTSSPSTSGTAKTEMAVVVSGPPGFQDLPIRKVTLGHTRREQMRAHAQDIQQKLRHQMGRIKTKFNNMPKTSLKRKESADGESPKSHFSEIHVPKISFPDRSKFKLPEGAKFHLPESAKLNLSIQKLDKSKFHLPERPKLNLTEKFHFPDKSKFNLAEKIHLPDKAKFHLPEKPKFNLADKIHIPDKANFHFPDKSKFHLPDKSKFHLPDKSKFHLPDKSKFHLPDKAKFHLPEGAKLSFPEISAKLNRPKLEIKRLKTKKSSQKPSISSPSKLNFKSSSKVSGKQSKDYVTSSPKQTKGRTPPPRMMAAEAQPEKISADNWTQNLEDLRYADDDDDAEEDMKESDSRKSESLLEYPEKDFEQEEDFEKGPEEAVVVVGRTTHRIFESDSLDSRKKGVLEEINSDEYFLRQKGISQDDIDMGKYLSREIREAFRSPGVNTLAKMDYPDDENVEPKSRLDPATTTRTSAVKAKSILKKTSTSDPSLADDGYRTYPPIRPGRKSRSQSKSLLNEEVMVSKYETSCESRFENTELNLSKYDNVDSDEDDVSDYYKTPKPAKEYEHYKVPRSHPPAPPSPSPPMKRKPFLEIPRKINEIWNEVETPSEPPVPMARKKSGKKNKKKILEEVQPREQRPQKFTTQSEEDVLEVNKFESPVPPKRTRPSRFRSLMVENEMNRDFHSENEIEPPEDESMVSKGNSIAGNSLSENWEEDSADFVPTKTERFEITDLDDVGFGYATVGKPTVVKPQRRKKRKPPERPPPPKKTTLPVYNAHLRRAPVRPLRNYSTLGPSRPPRRSKSAPLRKQNSDEKSRRSYSEIHSKDSHETLDAIEISGSSKDLQTEKVIEKMKGRPLPPPPRPPRQKSKGPEDAESSEEQTSFPHYRDDEFLVERQVTTAFVHEPLLEKEFVQEISASNQANALPEDSSFEGEGTSDAIQELSHEQLRMQQAYLDEMKREEEELRRKGVTNDSDAELKAEVIRQIEGIIEEERRELEERIERKKTNSDRLREKSVESDERKEEKKKTETRYLDAEADMGYASLERRGHRRELVPVEEPPPMKSESLQVRDVEADTICVREVQADRIFVKELQSNRINAQEIDNTGGNAVLGDLDFSPSLIDQIVAKIPWTVLRDAQERTQSPAREASLSFPQQMRLLPSPSLDDSEEERNFQPRRPHRRHRKPQHSSGDEGEEGKRKTPSRSRETGNVADLSFQLARACTSASVRAVNDLVRANAPLVRSIDREMFVQIILSIAIALVAAYFLFGFDGNTIHFHRWDFHNFPPQPPSSIL